MKAEGIRNWLRLCRLLRSEVVGPSPGAGCDELLGLVLVRAPFDRAQVEAGRSGVLPKSVLAKACNYTLTLWTRLTRFLQALPTILEELRAILKGVELPPHSHSGYVRLVTGVRYLQKVSLESPRKSLTAERTYPHCRY